MKLIGFISLLILSIGELFAQDIGVVNVAAPNSGCMLSSTESVTVTIFNFGATTSAPISISYSIDGGAPVTEPYPLASFSSSGTYTHTFATPADLSVNGSHNFLFYTTIAGDVNNLNDTATSVVVSDALSVGGTVNSSATVCEGTNMGNLALTGNTGDSLIWETSTDAGTSWSFLSSGSTNESYTNLTVETLYRVTVKNGYCLEDFSSVATISIDPVSVGGILTGPDTVCAPPNSGTATLSGETGTVQFWESSDDGGATWSTIANTNTTNSFTDIPGSMLYRVNVQSGSCAAVYSDTLSVYVNPGAFGGTLTSSASNVCVSGNSGSLELTGEIGSVDHWEYSTNSGTTWNGIMSTSNIYSFTNLATTTWFRVIVLDCNTDTSNVVVVTVDPISVGGTLSADTTVCEGTNSGSLNLSGYTGNITDWEVSSDGGATWISTGDTGASYNFSNLINSSMYRVIVGGGACASDTSSLATVFVDQASFAGTLSGPSSVCASGNSGIVSVNGSNGVLLDWYSSVNGGATWNSLSNVSPNQFFTNITQSTDYLVEVKNGVCPADSAIWSVGVDAVSNAGVLLSDTTVCLNSSGMLNLSGTVASTILWRYSTDSITWPVLQYDSLYYEYLNATENIYYMAIATNGSCASDTANIVMVSIYEYNFGTSGDTIIEYAETAEISAYGGVYYSWTPDKDIDSVDSQSPLVWPLTTTEYIVSITDSNGCVYSDSVKVTVNPQGALIPSNLVTRNNDGYNDTWKLIGLNKFPLTKVLVFNINGMKVYESEDYQNDWDGTYNGNPLPDGTYYYVVTSDMVKNPIHGHLTLISE